MSGPGEAGGFSVSGVVVLADSQAEWRWCLLMSLGWVNFIPVDLASLSGSVIAWRIPNVRALFNFKSATFTENPGLRVSSHMSSRRSRAPADDMILGTSSDVASR
jgi:hypothetical protein